MNDPNTSDVPIDERVEPAIVIDLERNEILACNAAARRVWGMRDGDTLPIAVDPGMPAFDRLRAMDSDGATRSHVFWTRRGAQSLRCCVRRLTRQTLLLVFNDTTETGDGPGAADLPANGSQLDAGAISSPEAAAVSPTDQGAGNLDLRTMAHELRTPLAAVIALAEMIEKEQFGAIGDPRYREYARDIGDSARLTLHIVASALENDASEGGILPGGFAEFDVAEIVLKCIRAVRQTAAEAGIELERKFDDGLPILIANGPALTQILLNLLTNAIKFTPSGGKITIEAATGDTGTLQISVTDTGVGMTNSATRVLVADDEGEGHHEEAGREDDGSIRPSRGIGFSLVRRLAGAMGAVLEIYSMRGVGTRVGIIFSPAKVIPVAVAGDGQLAPK